MLQIVCTCVAVAMQYFFSCAFMWMLLEGYQLYLMLVQVFETTWSRSIVYHAIAYGWFEWGCCFVENMSKVVLNRQIYSIYAHNNCKHK
jgi:hypothetical protein